MNHGSLSTTFWSGEACATLVFVLMQWAPSRFVNVSRRATFYLLLLSVKKILSSYEQ